MNMENRICTITTHSHLFKVAALFDSVAEWEPAVKCAVLVVDPAPLPEFFKKDQWEVHTLKDLEEVPLAKEIIALYNQPGKMDRLRWSLKPIFLQFLLLKPDSGGVIYLDNDIYFHAPFGFLLEKLEQQAMLLTLHWRTVEPEEDEIEFLANFRDGQFNGGFVGVSNKGMEALKWWANACRFKCEKDRKHGFYDDQRYMDALPVRFDDVEIMRHQGCNVAVWNRIVCKRTVVEGKTLINEQWPIVFIHYSTDIFAEVLYWKRDPLLIPFVEKYVGHLQKYMPEFNFEHWKTNPPKGPSLWKRIGWMLQYYRKQWQRS